MGAGHTHSHGDGHGQGHGHHHHAPGSYGTPIAEALEGTLSVCAVCGGRDLYRQKDFRRSLGLALAAVGLLLGPFTSWISVGVAVVVDAVLYLVVGNVSVCYACDAQVRGLPKARQPAPFDIAVHDAYKFGKRFPPRRDVAVAGPLARRLRREGKG